MLKDKIIEIMDANLPDKQNDQTLSHAADAIIDLFIHVIAEMIAGVLKAYEEKGENAK
jgi:hypothetical protein